MSVSILTFALHRGRGSVCVALLMAGVILGQVIFICCQEFEPKTTGEEQPACLQNLITQGHFNLCQDIQLYTLYNTL